MIFIDSNVPVYLVGSPLPQDALHIAVMERYGVATIFSFDRDYDRHPGLDRISRA